MDRPDLIFKRTIRDPKARKKWASTRTNCYLCGVSWDNTFCGLDTHHIFQGAMRSDEPCNLLRLCATKCHVRAHFASGEFRLTKGQMLWLKKHHDPDEYDEKRLLALSCRATLPELEEPKR